MLAPQILPVILSGGSGTRLWPLSTLRQPKQFQSLVGEQPMIAATAARAAAGVAGATFLPPLVIGNAGHEPLLRDALLPFSPDAFVLEPMGRNTAGAIAIAALVAAARAPEAILLVLPSDHAIIDVAAFAADAALAARLAQDGYLVTFGIVPTEPHTGYGYIARGAGLPGHARAFAIDRFVEKPALALAQQMLADGIYDWNSGMFAFAARTVLDEFALHAPDVLASARAALAASAWDGDRLLLDSAAFAAVPSVAFDVAVMEKTQKAAVIEAGFDWTDVGSWPALHDVIARDTDGNSLRGENIAVSETTNCYVRNETPVPIFVSGLEDVSIVVTENGIVVTSRAAAQSVRQAAAQFDKP